MILRRTGATRSLVLLEDYIGVVIKDSSLCTVTIYFLSRAFCSLLAYRNFCVGRVCVTTFYSDRIRYFMDFIKSHFFSTFLYDARNRRGQDILWGNLRVFYRVRGLIYIGGILGPIGAPFRGICKSPYRNPYLGRSVVLYLSRSQSASLQSSLSRYSVSCLGYFRGNPF